MNSVKKVIVLGIDGLDPFIAEKMMDQGDLSAFSRLARNGSYARLTSAMPPQSPVAWTSIATGKNPGEHGIFDFLHRDAQTYLPYLSILKNTRDDIRNVETFESPVKCKMLWEMASDKNIHCVVVRWPLTFPPKKIRGRMLAGLGVPDINGELGRHALYTTNNRMIEQEKKGMIIPVNVHCGRVSTYIAGPVVRSREGVQEVKVPLQIRIESTQEVSVLFQKKSLHLVRGQWSPWVECDFPAGFMRLRKAQCKFYLISVEPEFNLYLSPLHVSPFDRECSFSFPESYAQELRESLDVYATLGIPEDTNALIDNAIDEDAFLMDCDAIMREREKMFYYEFEKFQEGLFCFVFDTTDRIQHMLWRFRDASHPLYDDRLSEKYESVIRGYYRRMDKVAGFILEKLSSSPDVLVIVCSDHGFCSFRKSVHINTWLAQNGFMKLKGSKTSSEGLFKDVDWENTKAYALGLNSVYVNLRDREGKGIVSLESLAGVKREIAEKLSGLADGGERVVKKVYDSSSLYSGKEMSHAPDLVIGYERGYRGSWQSAVGQVPAGGVVVSNDKKWSGDHCCDASCVPGVLFANKKSVFRHFTVSDIAPVILSALQV